MIRRRSEFPACAAALLIAAACTGGATTVTLTSPTPNPSATPVPTSSPAPTPSPTATPLPASVIASKLLEKLASYTAWKQTTVVIPGVVRLVRPDGSVEESAVEASTRTASFETPNRSDVTRRGHGTQSSREITIGRVRYEQNPVDEVCGPGRYVVLIEPDSGNPVINPTTGRAATRSLQPGAPCWEVGTLDRSEKVDTPNVQFNSLLLDQQANVQRGSDTPCGQGECYTLILELERAFESPAAIARRVTYTWLVDKSSFVLVAATSHLVYISDGKEGFKIRIEFSDYGVPSIKPPSCCWP